MSQLAEYTPVPFLSSQVRKESKLTTLERGREREKQPVWGQAEARRQELHWVSHMGFRDPSVWAIICSFPGVP